jgi:hypothetical protein
MGFAILQINSNVFVYQDMLEFTAFAYATHDVKGADSGVDPPHEFFFSHRTPAFRKLGAFRSTTGGTHGYHPLPHWPRLISGPVHRSAAQEDGAAGWISSHLRARSNADAGQRSAMPLAQVGQATGEILESGGPWQFEGEHVGLEHSNHLILRRALGTKALHGISFLVPCRKVRLQGGPCHRRRQRNLLVGLYL